MSEGFRRGRVLLDATGRLPQRQVHLGGDIARQPPGHVHGRQRRTGLPGLMRRQQPFDQVERRQRGCKEGHEARQQGRQRFRHASLALHVGGEVRQPLEAVGSPGDMHRLQVGLQLGVEPVPRLFRPDHIPRQLGQGRLQEPQQAQQCLQSQPAPPLPQARVPP